MIVPRRRIFRPSYVAMWQDELEGLLCAQSEERVAMLNGVLADVFRPLSEWPPWEARRFLQPRLGHKDRCGLSMFVLGNGMPPCVYARWCLSQKGYLRHEQSALHLSSVIKDWAQGNLGHREIADAMNPAGQQMRKTMHAPNFILETVGSPKMDYFPGERYWKDACKMLDAAAKRLPKKGGCHRLAVTDITDDQHRKLLEECLKLAYG